MWMVEDGSVRMMWGSGCVKHGYVVYVDLDWMNLNDWGCVAMYDVVMVGYRLSWM